MRVTPVAVRPLATGVPGTPGGVVVGPTAVVTLTFADFAPALPALSRATA